jgi:hypothetical protein
MSLKSLAKTVLFRPGLRKHRIIGGALKGMWFQFDLRCDTHLWRGIHEVALQQWLQKYVHPGDTCLDIGGADGYYSLLMASLTGPTGSVHAFEPSDMVERIKENFAINPDLKLAPLTCHNAFVGPDHDPDNRNVSIDGLLKAGAFSRVDIVKIDVDGPEMTVLEGMGQTVAQFHPHLFVEVHSHQLHEQVEALTRSWGYTMRLEMPPPHELRIIEFNAFMISDERRDSAAPSASVESGIAR